MHRLACKNLEAQENAFAFLKDFLQFEYAALEGDRIEDVFAHGKSIHTLIGIIHGKRLDLRVKLAGMTVRDFAGELPEAMGRGVVARLRNVETLENQCSRLASRNAELARTLAGYENGASRAFSGNAGTMYAAQGGVQ